MYEVLIPILLYICYSVILICTMFLLGLLIGAGLYYIVSCITIVAELCPLCFVLYSAVSAAEFHKALAP